jgi:hypothetical protein
VKQPNVESRARSLEPCAARLSRTLDASSLVNSLPDLDAPVFGGSNPDPNSSIIMEERRNFQVLMLNFFENSAPSGAVADTATPLNSVLAVDIERMIPERTCAWDGAPQWCPVPRNAILRRRIVRLTAKSST